MSKIIWFHTYPQRLRCQDDKTLKQRGWCGMYPELLSQNTLHHFYVTGLRFVVVMGTTGNVLNEYHGLMKHRKITFNKDFYTYL